MAKKSSTYVLDALLDAIAEAERLIICSAEPATYAEANATYNLASIAMVGGDFSKADSGSNRQLTIAAKEGLTFEASGSGDHIVLVDDTNSRLLYVTTCPARSIQSSDTVNVASWTATVNQPT